MQVAEHLEDQFSQCSHFLLLHLFWNQKYAFVAAAFGLFGEITCCKTSAIINSQWSLCFIACRFTLQSHFVCQIVSRMQILHADFACRFCVIACTFLHADFACRFCHIYPSTHRFIDPSIHRSITINPSIHPINPSIHF